VFLSLLRRLTSTVAVARLMALVIVMAFALPAFEGACCAGVDAVAASAEQAEDAGDGCCAKDSTRGDGEARDEGSGDGTPCSCPFPCSAGCAGYLGRVLVQASSVALVEPAPELAVLVRPELAEPANPDPRDILHVPKRLVA
jgi:hypothetical protein